MDSKLREYLNVAREAAVNGGQRLRSSFGNANRAVYKCERDPVTQADLAAESAVLEVLTRHFPNHSFLSEETRKREGCSSLCWIVDPLDGTANYIHGLDHFAVSIALLKDATVLVGLVYQPITREMYTAVRGQGAFLNGSILRVSTTTCPSKSLLGTGFSVSLELRQQQQECLGNILRYCGAIRELGSAALGLCYVASGIFDGYYESALQPWDVAAGALLVMEAGGEVTGPSGTSFDPWDGGIVASNGWLHTTLLKAAWSS